jgi:hypothetical protein
MNGKPTLDRLPSKARLPVRDEKLRPSPQFRFVVRRTDADVRRESDPHKSRRELELRAARNGE